MDRTALIESLKVNRDSVVPKSINKNIIITAMAVIIVMLGGLMLVSRQSTLRSVQVAYASSTSQGAQSTALLDASGYVVARREATVSSKITGRVTELLIEEGQEVSAGQVIARLDASNATAARDQTDAQIGAAEAAVDLARVAETNSHLKFTRVAALYRSGWVSKQGLEDVRGTYDSARRNTEVAQRQLTVAHAAKAVADRSVDDAVVRAPFAGVVTVKAAQVGEIVSPISAGGGFTRTGIGTIVDMQSLEVEVDVAESYINRVQAGMPATVQLNAYPDWLIPAEVAAIIPTGDRSKATVKVRIRFKGGDARILPEMGASVKFLGSSKQQVSGPTGSAGVPPAAVLRKQDGSFVVFIVGENLKLERRTVRIGPRLGDRQIVLSGLRVGERVAVGNLSSLRDGENVQLNNQ